jgi:hypothetical protein
LYLNTLVLLQSETVQAIKALDLEQYVKKGVVSLSVQAPIAEFDGAPGELVFEDAVAEIE